MADVRPMRKAMAAIGIPISFSKMRWHPWDFSTGFEICNLHCRYANAGNILSQHARFLLDKDEAQKIIDSMREQVAKTWYSTVRAAGVSEKDAETISGCVCLSELLALNPRLSRFHQRL